MKKSWILGLIAMLLLASCGSNAPLHQYSKGDVLATNDFSSAGSFEEGGYKAATLQVLNGAYQINVLQGDNVLWWGQWGATYKDTVIDVDTQQQSEPTDNAYGVMCRVQGTVGQPQPVDATLAAVLHDSTPEATSAVAGATESATAESASTVVAQSTTEAVIAPTALLTATAQPVVIPVSSGDGYLFLIQGSGEFAIMRSRSRNLTPLVDWKTSDVIKQGAAQNHIRAICAGNYLAMYVNDQFMGDATDDTYSSGQVGLAASSADRAGTRITFDNLTISNAVSK